MSFDILVHTRPLRTDSYSPDAVSSSDYSNLENNQIGIYAFLQEIFALFPEEDSDCVWASNPYFDRYKVELSLSGSSISVALPSVLAIAEKNNLLVYLPADDETRWPLSSDHHEKASADEVDQFFKDNDDLQEFEKHFLLLPRDRTERFKAVEELASAGVGPAIACFIRLKCSAYRNTPLAKQEFLKLLDELESKAKQIEGKRYSLSALREIEALKAMIKD